MAALDWSHDDGINCYMINDFVRNRFYNNILAEEVDGKVCIEIGFGTGLLSLLALKHGAKEIIAYEKDHSRYCLGKSIIEKLGLNSKIKLINDSFIRKHYAVHKNADLVFSEIVDPNLWGEELYRTIPLYQKFNFLPSKYFFEIWYTELSEQLLHRLLTPEAEHFNPGVDIDVNFINLINELIGKKITPCTVNVAENMRIRLGDHTHQQLILCSEKLVGYEIDAIEQKLTFFNQFSCKSVNLEKQKNQSFSIRLDGQENKIILLIPRVGMKHKNYTLYLDEANCWGPAVGPILMINAKNNINITHDFITGEIRAE